MIATRKKVVIFTVFLQLFSSLLSAQEQEQEQPEMVVQVGHPANGISSLKISPDAKYLLSSGGGANTFKLWDINTGKEIRTFSGHSDSVNSLAFSPDGKYALSAAGSRYTDDEDNTLKLWDINTGKEIRTFSGHSDGVRSVSFSPDGKYALSGSSDETLKLWDINTGKEIRTFSGHSNEVWIALYSPNGNYVLSGSEDTLLKLWDITTGKEIHIFNEHTKLITTAAISSDGKYILSGSGDSTVKLWDVLTGAEIWTAMGHEGNVEYVQFSADGKYAISVGGSKYDRTIKFWDIKSGIKKKAIKISGHKWGIKAADYSPKGNFIITGGYEPFPKIWDTITCNEIKRFKQGSSSILTMDVSPNGKHIISGGEKKSLDLWDISTGRKIKTLRGHSDDVLSVVFSHEGKSALSGSYDNTMKHWDIETGAVMSTFLGHSSYINSVAFSPDGKNVLSGSNDETASLWDVSTGAAKKIFYNQEGGVNTVAFSPNGAYVLLGSGLYGLGGSGGPLRNIRIFDVDSGKVKSHLSTIGNECFYDVEVSPDGKYILTCEKDWGPTMWSVRWDTLKMKELEYLRFGGYKENIMAAAFSDDSRMVITGSSDSMIELWDVATGEEIKKFKIHSGTVYAVSFLPDSECVVSGSSDGTISILNYETGEWVAFMANTDGTEWLIFDSDGYWDSSPEGGDIVAMVRGLESWNIDQFAVRNNRPDMILKKLPNADPKQIDHYFTQYQRRLRRLGLTEEDLSDTLHVPSAEILETEQKGKFLTLNLAFSDEKKRLKSYNIYINDVPLFGAYGRRLGGRKRNVMETIELSAGENKIEVSCMNSAGAESFRAVTRADYDEPVKPDLYFIGFGVSEYKNKRLNLRYADKDAEDLERIFTSLDGDYQDVITRTYTNEQVTKDNIKKVKNLLMHASVDDTVVLFISGHGVHDRDEYASYYFLTHETDLKNLSGTAIDFEQLEDLFQRIPPRKKLFLMDTCGSGEWEPEMVRKVSGDSGGKGVWARIPEGEKGLAVVEDDLHEAGPDFPQGAEQTHENVRTYLYKKDRYIYNDLVRRSGAVVFSSCRGDEVSYENREYQNGLFTEYILRALGTEAGSGSRAADTDGDGLVSTEELRQYVIEAVSSETEGDPLLYAVPQHPTVDRDNIYVEFGF